MLLTALALPDDLAKAVFSSVTGGETAVAATSTKIAGQTTNARALQLRENELHAKMLAHRRRVLEKE